MREILEDLFVNQPLDPMEAARRNMRPNLRQRFYDAAASGPGLADTRSSLTVRSSARLPASR